jgi:hypothetical protein
MIQLSRFHAVILIAAAADNSPPTTPVFGYSAQIAFPADVFCRREPCHRQPFPAE